MSFDLIFQIGLIIFDSVLAAIFFLKFNRKRLNEKPLFYILVFMLLFIAIYLSDEFNVYAIILSIFVSFFMQIFCFGKKVWVKSILCSLIYFASLIFINSIVFNFVQIIIGKSITEIIQLTEIYVSICLISKSCLLLLIKFYLNIEASSNDKAGTQNNKILPLLVITILNIIIFIIFMFSSLNNKLVHSNLIIIFGMIGIFFGEITHYVMYFVMKSKASVELQLELLTQLKDYDQKIFEEKQLHSEKVAKINHDIKGHLMYIAYNIDKKSYDTAVNYIRNICGHIDNGANYISITNETINFMINFKTDIAKKKGIDIECHIEDIGDCCIEDFDLCALLNNMLDNALEATEYLQEKKICIQIYNYSGYQVFSVKNTIEKSVLHNKGLITNKKDKRNHGYGLKQIQSITEKYQGCMDIYEQKNFFCINIFIPHNK